MITMQMLTGANLGLTAASGMLAVVIVLSSGLLACKLALRGRYVGRSDAVCILSVLIAAASLCWIVRRVYLLLIQSPLMAAQPGWALVLANFGACFSLASMVLCLMYRAERMTPGRGKYVARWSLVVVGVSILGGALSA